MPKPNYPKIRQLEIELGVGDPPSPFEESFAGTMCLAMDVTASDIDNDLDGQGCWWLGRARQ